MMLTPEVVEMLNPLIVLLAIIAGVVLWQAVEEVLGKYNNPCCKENCYKEHPKSTCGEKL